MTEHIQLILKLIDQLSEFCELIGLLEAPKVADIEQLDHALGEAFARLPWLRKSGNKL